MKIAVVGATGLVGQKMLEILEERNFLIEELIPVASSLSIGKKVSFQGKEFNVMDMKEAISRKPAIAIFSAGGQTSLDWALEFAKNGTTVIDNSSAWRMDPDKKLIVPEINADDLTAGDKIIANPNCSTIQLVLVLAPLHRKYGIKRLVVSTYQSVTGTGKAAVDQLNLEENQGQDAKIPEQVRGRLQTQDVRVPGPQSPIPNPQSRAYPHQIYRNCLPHCDVFLENDYTKEEMKLLNETRKILGDEGIQLTATAVRVPVVGGHSESVNIEFSSDFDIDELKVLLTDTEGLIVQDDPAGNIYPMPINAYGRDEVFVGRIRRDHSRDNSLNIWIVADNLRKGAATNAVQIAEYLVEKKLVN